MRSQTRAARIAGAFASDLLWSLCLYALIVRAFDLSPLPSFSLIVPFIAGLLALAWVQRRWLGGTLGELLWDRTSLANRVFAWFVIGGCALWLGREAVWRHPLLLEAREWHLAPFAPLAIEADQTHWDSLPFYYLLGAWPTAFQGKPIFFTVPYEKGPPAQFIGRVIGRIRSPEIMLTLEGPRTPEPAFKAEDVKYCLSKSWTDSQQGPLGCAKIREASLLRHIREMRKISPHDWEIRWFEVDNDSIPEVERVRGIYLKASNDRRGEHRFVIITPTGTQQVVRLRVSTDNDGALAYEILEKSVRSLRLSEALYAGRALANRRLSETKLDELSQTPNLESFVKRVSEVQALLIAKISVEPKGIDAYYHLGGTAYMLLKKLEDLAKKSPDSVVGDLSVKMNEWNAIEKPLLDASYRFAKDVAPEHEHTQRLQNMVF